MRRSSFPTPIVPNETMREISASFDAKYQAFKKRSEERKQEMSEGFTIKDSGQREEFAGGMVRDTAADKIDYTLVFDGPMFKRWAIHLTNGAKKYAKRNWMKAEGEAERDRFRESATRHFFQWLDGDRDEDHAAAVIFNINGVEYIDEKQEKEILK